MSVAVSRVGWLIPTGLIFLTLLPAFGGIERLVELSSTVPITPKNARFFADPIPAVLHIFSTLTFCVVGAFQFSPSVRRKHPVWHRIAGRVLVALGLLSATTGMWMAVTYPPVFGLGIVLTNIRLVVGAAMIVFICLAVAAIRTRAVQRHRAFMMRAYGLGIAAGTQPFTLGIMLLISGDFTDFSYTLGLALGWLVNIFVVEWLIRRQKRE